TVAWDQGCIDLIEVICNKNCKKKPGNWSQACVDKVYSLCGAECQTDPPCAHDKCYAGPVLDPTCDPCVAKICAQSPYCCNNKWDNVCVDKIKTVCGESCPVKGDCVPWLPNETDPKCPGIDLSVGVPCNGELPVCNHGNTAAPAGLKIVHYPSSANQFGKCD